MIYLTQLIYIKEGQENVFHQFEVIAIPAILKYNGRVLLRIRPNEDAFIAHSIDKPYEIHLISFDSEKDFENFRQDKERIYFLHLKERSVKASILFQGIKL